MGRCNLCLDCTSEAASERFADCQPNTRMKMKTEIIELRVQDLFAFHFKQGWSRFDGISNCLLAAL